MRPVRRRAVGDGVVMGRRGWPRPVVTSFALFREMEPSSGGRRKENALDDSKNVTGEYADYVESARDYYVPSPSLFVPKK